MNLELKLDKAKVINGWMTDEELEFLAETATKSQIIVEFGCYLGRSTRALADNTIGRVYAVDPWSGEYFDKDGKATTLFHPADFAKFVHNLEDHIKTGKVIIVREYSQNYTNRYESDFVFIDGDHSKLMTYHDIMLGLSILRPGGILAGHDYGRPDWPGVKEAVDEVFSEVNLVETIWWKKI